MPGLEVLTTIRKTPSVQLIPVIVLTSSRQDSEIDGAYAQGASGYVVKASNSEERQEFVRHLAGFWLRFNEPPKTSPLMRPTSPPGRRGLGSHRATATREIAGFFRKMDSVSAAHAPQASILKPPQTPR